VPELKTILYVDDEPDIRAVVELSLGLVAGFQVTVCASGAEALGRAAELRPQLIMLDVMMPEMDGPATLAALRAQPATADIPVVFLTAKVQPGEVERLKEAGAVDVIAKPFDPMRLGDQVRAVWSALG